MNKANKISKEKKIQLHKPECDHNWMHNVPLLHHEF